MNYSELNKELGNIDIYLLDQILKGRYNKSMKILDVGCGEGRNLIYFLNNGFDIYGIDKNAAAIQMLQYIARTINTKYEHRRFIQSAIEGIPFNEGEFDVIICSAVLHFAENDAHFHKMLGSICSVTKTGGSLFIRMTSDIGIEDKVFEVSEGQYQIPDGSIRYLLKRKAIPELLSKYNLSLVEPVKTVNVEDKRCMTTLVLRKERGEL